MNIAYHYLLISQ